jgi:hypothetical protein
VGQIVAMKETKEIRERGKSSALNLPILDSDLEEQTPRDLVFGILDRLEGLQDYVTARHSRNQNTSSELSAISGQHSA